MPSPRTRFLRLEGFAEKAADPKDPTWVVMSAEIPADDERGGDVLRIEGMDCEDGIPLLAQHMRALSDGTPAVIGKVAQVKKGTTIWKGKKVPALLGLPEFADTPLANKYKALWPEFLNKVSIGAYIKEYQPIDPKQPWDGWDIKKSEIFELSVVTIPANPAAGVLRTICSTLGYDDNDTLLTQLKGHFDQTINRLIERLDTFEANSVVRTDPAEESDDQQDQQAEDASELLQALSLISKKLSPQN